MPKTIRSLTTFAAAAFALAVFAMRAHAQVETFETLSAYGTSDSIQGLGTNALSETFTNVLELQSITFRFTPQGTDNAPQNISAYLVQWNPGNDVKGNALTTFTAPTDPNATLNPLSGANPTDATQNVGAAYTQSFTVPPVGSSGWQTDTFSNSTTYQGYDVTLAPNQYLDPSLTYAIVLIDTTASPSGLGLLDINDSDPFSFGYATRATSSTSLSAVQVVNSSNNSTDSGGNGGDYGFSQIVIVPAGNVVPLPEPRTAAAILCAAFVAFLVGRRLLKQDGETLAGAVAA
ncbi:MAG TPA: hypothetical protein VHV47_01605 [Opitutaceae bacterium]|nr:hypothetical protein [Opitutaceae bacterium]